MGSSNTKESRHPGDTASRGHRPSHGPSYNSTSGPSNQAGLASQNATTSGQQAPYEQRRETKQEREARRLEKERVARLKERERSMKEEHVDGGYLVTLGTYVGPEDFNKQVVRHLQIDRRIAPFWRGLNDMDPQWTEFQIIAAARGLPIPPPDQTPPDELIPRPLSSQSPVNSSQNLNNLTVPVGGRRQSTASEHSGSNSGSALPSPVSAGSGRANSPFRPRGKSLAAVLGSSRNGSTTDITPREINLPNDPFVNGQPLEVYLYKNATECPICFLTYPPYLNHTRCCDQPICSECFVQIKRPDPHYPEGHNENDPNTSAEESIGMLVSEPACCPYCTQPDFGVTYEPPPFRRGLAHAISSSALGAMNTAMSSSSSLNSSTLSPTLGSLVAQGNRRRTQSLSANAPNVTLTDRIRPDWSTKLQSARAHQARRSAAATALHTAAFLMGNAETRPFRVSRFGRRNTGSGSASPGGAGILGDNATPGGSGTGTPLPAGPEPGPRGSSGRGLVSVGPSDNNRRSRMEDLEDMMFMEAIRLSLAAEEERKRKADKEERKDAKKREKEERKAAKAAAKHGPYETSEGRSGHSSASGSSLSLSGLGFGRKRGNSGASTLRVEASVANAMASSSGAGSPVTDVSSKDKGKGVERSLPSTPEVSQDGSEDGAEDIRAASTSTISAATASTARPIPSPQQHVGPSHLRQMSTASSIASSLPDSQAGSYSTPSHLQDPTASGLSLGSRTGEDSGDRDREPSASTEPMFNFSSLAEVVGVSLEGENAGRRLSRIEADKLAKQNGEAAWTRTETKQDEANDGAEVERIEDVRGHPDHIDIPVSAPSDKNTMSCLMPPDVTITPETPAPIDGDCDESKQLGYTPAVMEHPHQVTQ